MKVKIFITSILILFKFNCIAQENKYSQTEINSPTTLQSGLVNNYLDDIEKLNQDTTKKEKILNNKMMNVFFASEVGNYVFNSEDLSLQRAYAVLDTDDSSLFLGGTFELFRKKKTDKLTYILTTGVKAKLDKKFSTFFKNGDAQNEIGFNLKLAKIGNGILNYTGYKKAITDLRKDYLEDKINSDIKTYLDGDYKKDIKKINAQSSIADYNTSKKTNELIESKEQSFYEQMADEEIKYIKENKVYNFFSDNWFSIEGFIPATKKEYTLLTDNTAGTTKNESFIPWSLNGSWNYLRKYSSGKSYLFNLKGKILNNNNIDINELTKFTQVSTSTENQNLQSNSTTVYSGDFDEFTTTSLGSDFTFFFIKNGFAGLSAGLEQNFGKFDSTNWKLGIPFSLKDKEGKSTVNFELQWKEVNKNHLVGMNVGYSFGKFLK